MASAPERERAVERPPRPAPMMAMFRALKAEGKEDIFEC